jgi:hypothetical protein
MMTGWRSLPDPLADPLRQPVIPVRRLRNTERPNVGGWMAGRSTNWNHIIDENRGSLNQDMLEKNL